jgi:hypothetical protein
MRILVLGEGPNDLGRAAADGSLSQAGPIPIFVERLVEEVDPTRSVEIAIMPWKNVRGHRGTGFDRKLLHAFGIYGRNIGGVVGVADRDGSHNWSRAKQLESGAKSLAEQGVLAAIGLNVEMLEATLLADEVALRTALRDPSIECQPDPESLTSRDETSDRNPKGRLQRLITASPADSLSSGFSEHYAAIARQCDLAVLERRCPSGFRGFAASVRELAFQLSRL